MIYLRTLEQLMDSENPIEKISFNNLRINDALRYFNASQDKRIITICTVIRGNNKTKQQVYEYINENSKNKEIYYVPFDYTSQVDPFKGLTICNTTTFSIGKAQKYVLQQSDLGESWIFNLGATIYFRTELGEFVSVDTQDEKIHDFLNALKNKNENNETYADILDFRKKIMNDDDLVLDLKYDSVNGELKLDKWQLLKFGMVFAMTKVHPGKTFRLYNIDNVIEKSVLENKQTPPKSKSYSKVALILHNYYKGMKMDEILKQQYL